MDKNKDKISSENDDHIVLQNDVMDEGDIAQLNQLKEIEEIGERAKRMNPSEIFDGFDGMCVECGIEIPLGRIKLGKIRCIDCQEEMEYVNNIRNRGVSKNIRPDYTTPNNYSKIDNDDSDDSESDD